MTEKCLIHGRKHFIFSPFLTESINAMTSFTLHESEWKQNIFGVPLHFIHLGFLENQKDHKKKENVRTFFFTRHNQEMQKRKL